MKNDKSRQYNSPTGTSMTVMTNKGDIYVVMRSDLSKLDKKKFDDSVNNFFIFFNKYFRLK